MGKLTDLPPELLSYIARWLNIEEILFLAATCRHMRKILDELQGQLTVLSGAAGNYYCSTAHPETKYLGIFNPAGCEMITAHSMNSILVKKYNGTAVLNFCGRSRSIQVVDAVFGQSAVFTATHQLVFDRANFSKADPGPSMFIDDVVYFIRCTFKQKIHINKITSWLDNQEIRVVFEECNLANLQVKCQDNVRVHYALRKCTWKGPVDLTQMGSLEIDWAPAAAGERGIVCSSNVQRPVVAAAAAGAAAL